MRKSPIKHKVSTYKKTNGTVVNSYVRGQGQRVRIAIPTIKFGTEFYSFILDKNEGVFVGNDEDTETATLQELKKLGYKKKLITVRFETAGREWEENMTGYVKDNVAWISEITIERHMT